MSCQHDPEDGYSEEKVWCHTQFRARSGSLTCKISDFSVCPYQPGEYITSPEFHVVGDEKSSWNLHLYPNGKTREKKDFVAVFFHSNAEKITEPVTCQISILDDSGEKTESKELTYYSNESAGWDEFISRSSLIDVKKLLLPNDELTVHCELTAVKKLEKSWKSSSNRPQIPDLSHGITTLASDMGQLLQNDSPFSDVFKVDGAKISAHKVVLMARSPVFSAMFKQDMQEAETNLVIIKDIEVHVFREMLSFIYTNDCGMFGAMFAMLLLAAADKYCIPSLKTLCADFLNDNLSEDNVFDVVECADAFGEKKLRKNCVEFICRELSHLVKSDAMWKSKIRFQKTSEVAQDILYLLAEKETSSPESELFAVKSNSQSNCNGEPQPTLAHFKLVERRGLLQWKISGLSMNTLEKGEFLQSPKFEISSENTKCYLQLYPNGETDDDKGVLSCSICSELPNDTRLEGAIVVKNANGEILRSIGFPFSFGVHLRYKCNKLISRKTLFCDGSRSRPIDEFVVLCRISVSKLSVESPKIFVSNDHGGCSLTKDFGRLLEEKEFTDAVLEINDAKIPAHKIVLTSRSSVFARMVEENKNEESLKITDVKQKVFRGLLCFLYTDECSLKNVYEALDMLHAAHKYDVPFLKVKCVRYLYGHMSERNVIDIAISAFSVKEKELYEDCLHYFHQELPSVSFFVWRLKKLHSHPDILKDFIERYIV